VKIRAYFVECGRADAPDLAEFLNGPEGPVLATMVLDPLGQTRAKAGDLLELNAIGAVEIGQGRGHSLGRPRAQPIPVATKGKQDEEQKNHHTKRELRAAMRGGRRWLSLSGCSVHDGKRAADSGRATI
jgi:hypothetical protein